MKNFLISIIFPAVFVILLNGCSKESATTEPPPPAKTGDFFPMADGFYFIYNVTGVDTLGNNYLGIRKTIFSDSTTIGGTVYFNQYDSLTVEGNTTANLSFVRETDAGVYYFLDTTGLFVSLPDTGITIEFDPELIVLSLPLTEGRFWDVFKMIVDYPPFGIFNFAVVDVSASYEKMEGLTLNLSTGQVDVSAVKVKFSFIFNNFLTQSTYTAYAWFVEDIGIVKWEGNTTVVNALSGAGIDFADTSGTVTQTLLDYKTE